MSDSPADDRQVVKAGVASWQAVANNTTNGAEQVGAWNPHAPLGNLKRIDDTKWLHTTAVRVNKNAAQEQLQFERVPRVNGNFSQY